MDVKRRPNLRDDLEMDDLSFGSNYLPSSQSKKMSVGLMKDSGAECRIQKVKQGRVKISQGIYIEDASTMAHETSSKENFANGENNKVAASSSTIRNQRDPTEQQTSPWVSTKTTFEAVTPAEKPSIVNGLVDMCNKSNRVEVESASLMSFKIQTKTVLFDKSEQVKEYAATEKAGKFASVTVLEAMPEKEVKGNKITKTENAGTENLRLKLREILGGVTSQCPSSPFLKQDAKGSVGEPKQNSDTIESDTQTHEYAIRRPTTRSFSRKRVPPKLPSRNRKRPPTYKEDRLEKNVFLSKDQCSRTPGDGGNDSPVRVYGRRGKRKGDQIEAPNICKKNNVSKDDATSNSSERVPAPEKLVHTATPAASNGSSLCKEKNTEVLQTNSGKPKSPVVEMSESLRNLHEHIGNLADKYKRKSLDSGPDNQSPTFSVKTSSIKSFPGFSPRSNLAKLHGDGHELITPKTDGICKVKSFDGLKRDYMSNGPVNVKDGESLFQEKNAEMVQPNAGKPESPAVEVNEQLRNLQQNINLQGNLADKYKIKSLDSESDKQSLTFSVKASSKKSFPGFAPKSELQKLHGDSHEPITSKTEGICKVKSFDGLKRDYKSNRPDESSDDTGNPESAPFPKPRRTTEEDTQKMSSMENDSEGSEESFNIQGGTSAQVSLKFGNTREQMASHLGKRLFNKGCAASSKVNSTEIDCRKFQMHLELNQDPRTSAITLIALSLEKVKNKLKSVTNQKSAEILKSVAETIHTQLQKAESQIQADMGKISSENKSKRKHVEEVLQEKQQHLNAIYERFKEEVNQHLQDCRSTLESLEAHEVEVKATVEKRKASNRKLLSEVEEAIESELDNAERSINEVHHAANEKMRQLKMVVSQCLKEGMLG